MLSPETAAPTIRERPRGSRGEPALPAWVFAFADRRDWVVVFALAAAILLPEFTLSSRLPAVRVEQVLLPYGLFAHWLDRRRGRPFRVGFLDWIFTGLALSTLISIVGAPLMLRTHLSLRDFYELLKVALYYVFYRLASSSCAETDSQSRWLRTTLVAGTLGGLFAVGQYFDWLRVNAWLTPLFAPDPHLGVLRESGRVVGTIGNPNYLGIFCVMLALAALLVLWLPGPPQAPVLGGSRPLGAVRVRLRWMLPRVLPSIAAMLACLGLVMSGSRTALLALAGAMVALLVLAATGSVAGGGFFRLTRSCALLLLLLFSAVVVVEVFPRGQVDYLARISGGLSVNEDASFGLRLARWRSVIGVWLPGRTLGGLDRHSPLTSVHATGAQAAPPEVLARDAQRKSDLLRLATAIDAYHRATSRWPAPSGLTEALVPQYIASIPADPSTGESYTDVAVVSGYSVMTRLENAADPDFPVYGVGSSPNYLLNGDLERGGTRPSNWDAIPGSSLAAKRGDSLFGDRSVVFRGNTEHLGQRGGVYQQRYFGRRGGNPFTATVWLKLTQPAAGRLDLYANVIYTDGGRADPLTRIPADMSRTGVWQKVSLWILPPAEKTLAFLGVYVVSDGFSGEALLDGFELVDGPVPLSFALTREAPPSDTLGFNPEARLRRSPVIGVGPEKGEQGSSLDDEYLLYAARYGLIGIAFYLCLYLGTLVLALRACLQAPNAASRRLAALVAVTVVAFFIFNLTAGSFYELQLMAIFWLLAGAALSTPRGREVDHQP